MRTRHLAAALATAALAATGCGQYESVHASSAVEVVAVASPSTAHAPPAATPPTVDPEVYEGTVAAAEAQAPRGTQPSASNPASAPAAAAPQPEERTESTTEAAEQRTEAAEQPAPDPAAALWNRTFASVRVTEGGTQRTLARGTRLRIQPAFERGERFVRYGGSCNTGGADLRITQDRFLVADTGGMSSASCGDERDAQENWYVEFVHTSPHWRLSAGGDRLTLTSGDTVIVFEQHPWPPWSAE